MDGGNICFENKLYNNKEQFDVSFTKLHFEMWF